MTGTQLIAAPQKAPNRALSNGKQLRPSYVGGHGALRPMQDALADREKLEAQLSPPATPDQAKAAVFVLMNSLPVAKGRLLDETLFGTALAEDLGKFSRFVLGQLVEQGRRERFKVLPSIQEILALGDEIDGGLREERRRIDREIAEHERRRKENEEKERKSFAARQRQREEQRRMIEHFGPAAADGAFDLGHRIRPTLRWGSKNVPWMARALQRETWALDFGRKMMIAARAAEQAKRGAISYEQAAAIARGAIDDESGALAAVEALGRGEGCAIPADSQDFEGALKAIEESTVNRYGESIFAARESAAAARGSGRTTLPEIAPQQGELALGLGARVLPQRRAVSRPL